MNLVFTDKISGSEINKDCWSVLLTLPEGTNNISFVFDHGKKSIYLNGELYFVLDQSERKSVR